MAILKCWALADERCLRLFVLFGLPFCPDPFLFRFYGYPDQRRFDFDAANEMSNHAMRVLKGCINKPWVVAPEFCAIASDA